MICEIPTLVNAFEIIHEAMEARGTMKSFWYDQLVFDLGEDVDPNDVPVSISQCETCNLMIHFKLGDDNDGVCPRCHHVLKELVVVMLVIQGAMVMSTNWRNLINHRYPAQPVA